MWSHGPSVPANRPWAGDWRGARCRRARRPDSLRAVVETPKPEAAAAARDGPPPAGRSAAPSVLGLGYAIAAAALALFLHPIEVPGAENDQFVAQAEGLLAGALPRDPFHPSHYPLLIAAS